jgi:two-component system, cell cycle sensor histidine kinase and response regulator CckA
MASPSRSIGFPSYDAQVLLNSQPVIVSVIDPQTHQVQFQNATGLKKFGDIGGFSCYEKIAGCQSPCSFCRMPEALTADSVVSSEVPLPGNQYLLVHLVQSLDDRWTYPRH